MFSGSNRRVNASQQPCTLRQHLRTQHFTDFWRASVICKKRLRTWTPSSSSFTSYLPPLLLFFPPPIFILQFLVPFRFRHYLFYLFLSYLLSSSSFHLSCFSLSVPFFSSPYSFLRISFLSSSFHFTSSLSSLCTYLLCSHLPTLHFPVALYTLLILSSLSHPFRPPALMLWVVAGCGAACYGLGGWVGGLPGKTGVHVALR